MLQPLSTNILDLSKPIVETPSQVGDVYFDGFGWKTVAVVLDGVMGMQDCTEYVRAVGRIHAPDGVAWSVAAYEMVNAKDYDPNLLW